MPAPARIFLPRIVLELHEIPFVQSLNLFRSSCDEPGCKSSAVLAEVSMVSILARVLLNDVGLECYVDCRKIALF